jgi:hypothetical protein
MSSIPNNLTEFKIANIDTGVLSKEMQLALGITLIPLPREIELSEDEQGAIVVSIRVGQYATKKELIALIDIAIKWRKAAFKWNGGHRKDGKLHLIESINRMHTSAGGRWSYSQIAQYINDLIEMRLKFGLWDDARDILVETLRFSAEETDDILDIARPRVAEGLPPFPEEYPPVTEEKVKRRLRTWRDKREPSY